MQAKIKDLKGGNLFRISGIKGMFMKKYENKGDMNCVEFENGSDVAFNENITCEVVDKKLNHELSDLAEKIQDTVHVFKNLMEHLDSIIKKKS